jgi:hypothetical protein
MEALPAEYQNPALFSNLSRRLPQSLIIGF